jgi:hypothetical protein
MKKLLTLGMVLALIGVLTAPMAVMASNTGTQGASTTQASTINIVSKPNDSVAAVATITFPAGAPSATISVPYNNVDGTGDPQVLSGTVSEPVVQLHNTSAETLKVFIQVGTWTAAVASEQYALVDTTVVNQATVTATLTADGVAATVDTTITMATNTYKDLYLQVVLGALAGKTGTSSITILGETQ